MWKETKSRMFVALLITSIAVHVAFVAAVPTADATTTPAPAPTLITITDSPPPPPPPPPPPTVEPASPKAARIAPRATHPIARRRPAAPPQQVAAPVAQEPVDLSGTTLSNDGGSWSTPTGNGEVAREPIVAPAAPRQPTGRRAGDRVVAVGDLSRPPKAPDLDAALVANYPAEARRAGRTGKAVVRARIQPDGSVGMIRIVSETDAGFGTACKRTLTGSRWQAPLDAQRTAVATDINYTCTFSVAR